MVAHTSVRWTADTLIIRRKPVPALQVDVAPVLLVYTLLEQHSTHRSSMFMTRPVVQSRTTNYKARDTSEHKPTVCLSSFALSLRATSVVSVSTATIVGKGEFRFQNT